MPADFGVVGSSGKDVVVVFVELLVVMFDSLGDG